MALSKIQAESMNLADTYAFTGTVSGVPTGVTEADTWRVYSGFTPTTNAVTTITTNWERDDSSTFGKVGTGMTQSGGDFTFPSTGIWNVEFVIVCQGASDYYFQNKIHVSSDSGSNFTERTQTTCYLIHDGGGSSDGVTLYSSCMIDVTDASTFRVKFRYNTNGATSVHGSGTANSTYVQFTKLGDT